MAKNSCSGGRRRRRSTFRNGKRVLSKGATIARKGVADVYNVLNSGFNLGVKSVRRVLGRRKTRRHRRR